MAFRFIVGKRLAGLAAAGFMLVAAGCQGGDTLGAMKLPGLGGGSAQAPAQDDRISIEELQAFCPRVAVRDGGAFYDSFPRNVRDDPSKLIYRATIGDMTRSCTYANGMTTITVAVAGRIIPGPLGKTGTVRVPMRVTAIQGTQVAYSQTRNHEVVVSDTAGATQFLMTETNITIPTPTTRNVAVFVGYENPSSR